MRRALALFVLLGLVLAGCAGTPTPDDPVAPEADPGLLMPLPDVLAHGPHTFTTADYELGTVMVGGADAAHEAYEYESRIRGVVTVPDGDGPFPLAVFLHGQHSPCSDGQGSEGGNCDIPYRNDMGYLYLMESLASHGIATASILAHEINMQNGAGDVGMWARGELVIATVDALGASEWAARLDLGRVGLMGHSRGGEGVVTAVEVNGLREQPHNLSAVIALAPTDFAYRAVPGVPFLTLAPYCDGDVYSLHGLRQFDQSRFTDSSAVKVQLLVMGANHNNYNTMWGKPAPNAIQRGGDDAPIGRHQNTECDLNREQGGERLTLEETYTEATFHMGGFLRWTLAGETGFAPYFHGEPQPAATCPLQQPCSGATHVSTMAPGRVDLFWADETGVQTPDGIQATDTPTCRTSDCAANVYQSAWLADLTIVQEAAFTIGFEEARNVSATPQFNVRVGVPTHLSVTALGPPGMSVTFVGDETVTVPVDHPALFMPPALPVDPGVGGLGLAYLGGAKVSTNAVVVEVPGSVQGALREITLTFTGTGVDQVFLADAWLQGTTSDVTR